MIDTIIAATQKIQSAGQTMARYTAGSATVVAFHTAKNPTSFGSYSSFFFEQMALFSMMGSYFTPFGSLVHRVVFAGGATILYGLEQEIDFPLFESKTKMLDLPAPPEVAEETFAPEEKALNKVSKRNDYLTGPNLEVEKQIRKQNPKLKTDLAIVERPDGKGAYSVTRGPLTIGMHIAANGALVLAGSPIAGVLGFAYVALGILTERARVRQYEGNLVRDSSGVLTLAKRKEAEGVKALSKVGDRMVQLEILALRVSNLTSEIKLYIWNEVKRGAEKALVRFPSITLLALGKGRHTLDASRALSSANANPDSMKELVSSVAQGKGLVFNKAHFTQEPKALSAYASTKVLPVDTLRGQFDGILRSIPNEVVELLPPMRRVASGVKKLLIKIEKLEDSPKKNEQLKKVTFILASMGGLIQDKKEQELKEVLQLLSKIHNKSDTYVEENLDTLVKRLNSTKDRADNTLRNRVALILLYKRRVGIAEKNDRYIQVVQEAIEESVMERTEKPSGNIAAAIKGLFDYNVTGILRKSLDLIGMGPDDLDHNDNITYNTGPLSRHISAKEYFKVWVMRRLMRIALLDRTQRKDFLLTPDDYIKALHDEISSNNDPFLMAEVDKWRESFLRKIGVDPEGDSELVDILDGETLVRVLLVDLGVLEIEKNPDLDLEMPDVFNWLVRKMPDLKVPASYIFNRKNRSAITNDITAEDVQKARKGGGDLVSEDEVAELAVEERDARVQRIGMHMAKIEAREQSRVLAQLTEKRVKQVVPSDDEDVASMPELHRKEEVFPLKTTADQKRLRFRKLLTYHKLLKFRRSLSLNQ